jgi:hypothetical protein
MFEVVYGNWFVNERWAESAIIRKGEEKPCVFVYEKGMVENLCKLMNDSTAGEEWKYSDIGKN